MFRIITRLLSALCIIFASIAQADHTIANAAALMDHLFVYPEHLQYAQQHAIFGPVVAKVANKIALDNAEYMYFCSLCMAQTRDIEQFLKISPLNHNDLLPFALQAGNLPAFKHLLMCGADPYRKEHLAVARRTAQTADAESVTAAEVSPEDITLVDCLTYAAKARQPQFVLACLEHTAQPTIDIVEIALECFALLPCDAVTHTALGDWIAQALCNDPSLLQTHYSHGGTLLCLFAEYGNVEFCKLALALCADPNFMTKADNDIYATPLVAASQTNSEQHHACIQLLLEHGANQNLHKPNQMLPLENAVRNDDLVAFELLYRNASSVAVKKRALLHAYIHKADGNIFKSLPIMYVQSNLIYAAALQTYITLKVQSRENSAKWLEKQKSPAWLAQPAAERQNVHAFLEQKFVEEQLQHIELVLEKSGIPLTLWCVTGFALRSNPEAFAWNADQTEPDYTRIMPLFKVFPQCIIEFFLNKDGVFDTISTEALEKELALQNNIMQACKKAIAAEATQVADLFTYLTPCSTTEDQIITNVVAAILGIHTALVNGWYEGFLSMLKSKDTPNNADAQEVA